MKSYAMVNHALVFFSKSSLNDLAFATIEVCAVFQFINIIFGGLNIPIK